MKALLIFATYVLLLAGFEAHSQQLPVTNGLVGFWPMNGDFIDASGNQNNGINGGSVFSTDRFNNPDEAIALDGIEDYVSTPLSNPIGNAFTITAWVKTESTTTYQTIASQYEVDGGFIFRLISGNKLRLSYLESGSYDFRAYATQLPLDSWSFVAASFDGTTASIYCNGALLTHTIYTQYDIATNAPFFIGKNGAGDDPFHGNIDDVMLFNRSLSQSEITQIYQYEYSTVTQASSPWLESADGVYFDEGNVGIGNSKTVFTDGNYKLAVDGKIRAREVKVTSVEWADFVFEPNYPLMPINQLEYYISLNGHLPSIPTEKEVRENGVSLGEINAKLLQKIEELTLYLIEQNKAIDEMKKEISVLKQR